MQVNNFCRRAKIGLVGLACAATPLALTASCSPQYGTLDVVRFDHHHHGFGLLDPFFDDCLFVDCFYEDEIIIFD